MEKVRGRRKTLLSSLVTGLFAVALLATAPGVSDAMVLGTSANPNDKVMLCHVNHSGTDVDPDYEIIEVSANGWKEPGSDISHVGHDANNDGTPDDFVSSVSDPRNADCLLDDPQVTKVTICHVTGNETYQTITVAGKAWTDREGTGHIAHSAGDPPHGDFEPTEGESCGFNDPNNAKVRICHAQGNGVYNELLVSGHAWFDVDGVEHGHAGHEDDIGPLAEGESCPELVSPTPTEDCDNGVDDDGDGDVDADDEDCQEPVEICDNGIDDDGDEAVDEGCGGGHGGGGGSRAASPTPTPEVSVSAPAALPARPPSCAKTAKQLGLPLITGTNRRDVLRGRKRSEVLCAKDGKDKILGGGGNDIIWAGRGDDVVRGGKGNDRIRGQRGNDLVYGDRGRDEITAGRGKDSVEGNAGPDRLYGQAMADSLSGGGADDAIYGGPAVDACSGGIGRNLIGGCENGTNTTMPKEENNTGNPTGNPLSRK